ncbi:MULTISPECIES: glycosyltransferase [unclassified Brenneria]|uniref:glycosyltransferase n=1 Tax=unclassified Brenneria TaxID=2634434 RepID=UPI0029C3E1B6|nr:MULTISPECIES: glycosyltransferase [unclassified Brenneria]MDX5630729.1 glycosyltransferase [Brenneria sp. L3-3Z]MDX5694219.1 glycosyltransferase [Brenneria sp. L4-2C]
MATLDLIGAFIEQNWQVDVYCHRYSDEARSEVERRYADRPLFITDDDTYDFSVDYDLLWLQYTSANASVLKRLLNGGIHANFIVNHLSLQSNEEMSADVHLENRLADYALVTIKRLPDFLHDNGILPVLGTVFPSPVPDNQFRIASTPSLDRLRKVLVVTNELTPVLEALPDVLADVGVQCDQVNNEQVIRQPNIFQHYDAVVATGRMAQYALCAGVPVYLYQDDRQFLGYVCSERLENNVFRSESVRNKTLTSFELADELVKGYSQAANYVAQRLSFYESHWRLSSCLALLLSSLPPKKCITITEQELQHLELHNLTLRDKVKPGYSVDKWLSERQITPARSAMLQAYIHNTPELGNVAVVVMDDSDSSANEHGIAASLCSVQEQLYGPQEVYVITRHPVATMEEDGIVWMSDQAGAMEMLNQLITLSSASFLLVLAAGDRLLPHMLLLLAEYRLRFPTASAFYFDETVLIDGKAQNPILKPKCNIDMLRSYPYIGRNLALDVQRLRQLGDVCTEYQQLGLLDVVYQLIEQEGPEAVGHIPEVVVYTEQAFFEWVGSEAVSRGYPMLVQRHLQRCHVPATVVEGPKQGGFNVNYQHDVHPLVSIIIPTRDNLPLLSRCIETLMEKTRYTRYELLIVDNHSSEPDACQYLSHLAAMALPNVRVLQWPHSFNFSAINNYAAEQASGEVLLFLNNDTEIVDGQWLNTMLQHALRPEVGIVGARLEFSDGRIQHGGIALGLNDYAGIVFQGAAASASGYMNRLQTTHNVSAVSAACMMMRRDVFNELGGYDAEHFPLYFGDVDLGIKARQNGYLVVWAAEARVVHLGGASRLLQKFELPPLPQESDIDALYQQWLPQLTDDPCYHPAYSKYAPGFALVPEMARCQLPLPGRPLPVILGMHADLFGCGHYRVIHPFKALEREFHIEGGLISPLSGVLDLKRIEPDVTVVQRAASKSISEYIKKYQKYSQSQIVLEYDDYLPNVPLKSIHRKDFSQSVIGGLRRCIEVADWIVVSTAPLAEELSKFHQDIRIAQNRLDPFWWRNLHSQRRVGKKIRIGWAGGSSHSGDLDILRPVIKALENEVEWVFMGMKPEGVACEFHAGVPIEFYPQKIASLNLDLALVPLEYNQFNACKSNLRLLELGACGVPVICTDIEPYRCDLPVTLVNNRFIDWMEAIRSHLADMDEAARLGDELREAVLTHWMLEESGLDDWLYAWLPR